MNYKSAKLFGITLDDNGSIDTQIAIKQNDIEVTPAKFHEKLQISLYPSYQITAGHFTAVFQPSLYFYRKKIEGQTSFFYQRLGIGYAIKNKFFI